MATEYRSIPSDEVLDGFSDEFKAKVAARAAELIAEEIALCATREVLSLDDFANADLVALEAARAPEAAKEFDGDLDS